MLGPAIKITLVLRGPSERDGDSHLQNDVDLNCKYWTISKENRYILMADH
jgi:hypothetical protein